MAANSHVSETTRNPSLMPTCFLPWDIHSIAHPQKKPIAVASRKGAGDSP